jgi:hypothetical protein
MRRRNYSYLAIFGQSEERDRLSSLSRTGSKSKNPEFSVIKRSMAQYGTPIDGALVRTVWRLPRIGDLFIWKQDLVDLLLSFSLGLPWECFLFAL